jgi:ubiquitin-protein ligase
MWILHPGQFASIFFRFASRGYDVTKVDFVVLTQDKWSAVYSVQTILLSLQSLLGGGNIFFFI